MKALCITSHSVDVKDEAGKFKKYKAGQVYEIPKLSRFFKAATADQRKAFEEKEAAYKKKIADRKKADGKDEGVKVNDAA